ncbi:MAG: 30S ribosomal protein S19e [Candidatus Aenigmatarchaeota archaeon]
MVTVYDVRPNQLIEAVAEELKQKEEVEQPDWSRFVKTSAAKERPPEREDWWYRRAASLLRKLYVKGPLGVNRLREEYSDRRDRGHKPDHSYPAGGKIIRVALQQLEEAGFLEKNEGEGRKITPEGRSFLDGIAENVKEG